MAVLSTEQNRSRYSLSSVDNSLRLILLIQERDQLRLSEAAEELGISKSTTHRLLATLAHRGFVVQERSRAYRAGPALLARPTNALGPSTMTLIHSHLMHLSAKSQETCHFVVLEGNGSRFVDGVQGPQVLRVGSRIGMLLPAHTNSSGKVLLSRLADSDLRALYPRGIPGGQGRVHGVAALVRELRATRRRGYGININESTEGISAVGRHVTDGRGVTIGAIAVAAPSSRYPRSRLPDLVAYLRPVIQALEAQL